MIVALPFEILEKVCIRHAMLNVITCEVSDCTIINDLKYSPANIAHLLIKFFLPPPIPEVIVHTENDRSLTSHLDLSSQTTL